MVSSKKMAPVDGDASFSGGMNSAMDPVALPAGTYCRAWNCVNRNGTVATRPGFAWRAALPAGKLQGITVFEPLLGLPQLVAVVAGGVYVSTYPYRQFHRLPNIAFDARKETVFFALTEQAATLNPDQSVALVSPRRVLFMQDGDAPPAFYDGFFNDHVAGLDRTPQGGPMVWTGGRLWVATRNRILASNILDPFNFTEQFYLGGSDAFYVDGSVTAMAETSALSGSPQLLVFTARNTTAFASNNRNRETWGTTPDFQVKLFSDVGCISHKSVRTQFGMLWWMTARGLTNLNYATQSRISSRLHPVDNEMADSKARMDGALHQVASGGHENFLLVSVPFGGAVNSHTWVADGAVAATLTQDTAPVWSSIWTGLDVFQWATPNINGRDRLYAMTSDAAGNNSLWEGFVGTTDNGQDIEAAVELRGYSGGSSELKRARFLEATFSEVGGEVNVAMGYRGANRGRYKGIQTATFKVGGLPVRSVAQTVTPTTRWPNGGNQSRVVRSIDLGNPRETADPLTSDGIELTKAEDVDFAFQHTVRWSGKASLMQVRWFAELREPEPNTGEVFASETESYTRSDGADSRDPEVLAASPPPVFDATASFTGSARGVSATETRSARSLVSEEAAAKQASQRAAVQVDHSLSIRAPKVYGP